MRSSKVGATLLEVVVVGSVFFVVMTALIAIFQATVKVQRHIELRSDLDRTFLVAARHLDASLRSSRLVAPTWSEPERSSRLELEPLVLGPEGEPVVTAEGWPELGPPFTIEFQAESGELVRIDTARRVLARLGDEGEVTFLRPNKGLLEMRLHLEMVGAQGTRTSRTTDLQFRLFNQ